MGELNPTIVAQAQNVGERLAATSCILEIHLRQPGFRKKMQTDTFLRKSGNNANVASDILHVSKDLIERRDIAYLEQHRTAFLQTLKGLSIPGGGLTLGNGQYLLPIAEVETVKIAIDRYREEREALLDQFENEYSNLIEKAKSKQGSLFDSSEYPPFIVIRNKYRLDFKFISNSIPEEFKKLSASLYNAEKSRISRELNTSAQDIIKTAREAYITLVTDFTENLGRDEETGKFRTLSEAKANQLIEFLQRFNSKNILGDNTLQELVGQARDAMTGVSLRKVKSDQEYREALKEKFDEISEHTQSLITESGRRINLEEL